MNIPFIELYANILSILWELKKTAEPIPWTFC